VVFYDSNGLPVEATEVREYGEISPGLGKRVTGQVEPSVKRLTTRCATYLSSISSCLNYQSTPITKLEIRVLDFELVQ